MQAGYLHLPSAGEENGLYWGDTDQDALLMKNKAVMKAGLISSWKKKNCLRKAYHCEACNIYSFSDA